jgi:hypothetical protein
MQECLQEIPMLHPSLVELFLGHTVGKDREIGNGVFILNQRKGKNFRFASSSQFPSFELGNAFVHTMRFLGEMFD